MICCGIVVYFEVRVYNLIDLKDKLNIALYWRQMCKLGFVCIKVMHFMLTFTTLAK